ncbi:MAG: hypothetical protein DWH91_14025 [Planctomycetota bacterium]|nr:MAG: hypothetical protein DWH91_14025 [Planctomycetota bacterium]
MRRWPAPNLILLMLLFLSEGVSADTLILKNGLSFEGKAVPLNELAVYTSVNPHGKPTSPIGSPFWLLDDQIRRYSFPGTRVGSIEKSEELSRLVRLKIPQKKTGQRVGPAIIGGFSHVEPFNEFGHGMVQLTTSREKVNILLGITELGPDYSRIEGLEYDWSFARSTTSLERDVLEKLLHRLLDRTDLDKRRATVIFYQQAGMSAEARREAESMLHDFPEQKERCEELLAQMDELDARRVLNEIQRRQVAGQHGLAYRIAKQFPNERVSADVSRQVQEMIAGYDLALERRDNILMQLDVLQAELPPEQIEQVRPLRNLLAAELHYESLPRLLPFEQAEADETLTPAARLALAYSSWVLGPAGAVEELPLAVRLWDMRFLVTEVLRDTDPQTRAARIRSLEETEGYSMERLAQLVPLLPISWETPPAAAGEATTITVPTTGTIEQIEYVRVLPPEYNPQHTYPLLVVLHDAGKDAEAELRWWAGDAERPGQSQRRGFITIAPRYSKSDSSAYEYDALSHLSVVESIRHAMRTHRIDADRIILTGHGMGGDACFDLGMTHPDLFAGVAPFCGKSTKYCMYYWENGMGVPWYVVAGQRDGFKEAENMRDLNRLFRKKADIIYCQYRERGYETYSEEQTRVLDWAELVRRAPLSLTKNFTYKTLRMSDDTCHWVRTSTLNPEKFPPIVWEDRNKIVREMSITAEVTPGGTFYIQHPGKSVSLWLNPDLVSFDERIKIIVSGREKMNDFPKPSAAALLEDLRVRADRSRLFWTRIDL